MSKSALNLQIILNEKLHFLLEAKPNEQSYEAIESCLKEGANGNVGNSRNLTALELAIILKHDHKIVSLLLDYGADPQVFNGCNSILYQVFKYKHSLPTIKKLLEKGADPNIAHVGGTRSILKFSLVQKNLMGAKYLIEYGAKFEMVGNDLLALALVQGDFETAEYLIDKGVSSKIINGNKPLFAATRTNCFNLVKSVFEKHLIEKKVILMALVMNY